MTEKESAGGAIRDLQQLITRAIKEYVAESPLNRLRNIDGSPIWEEPLVGFADGDDPLFTQYKTVVGEFHLTPREVLAQHLGAAPGDAWEGDRVSVVSWVLPIAKQTKLSNRAMVDGPSLRWNNTRFQGEDFNDILRKHVATLLEERGYAAVSPLQIKSYKTYRLPNGLASSWSERHAAYAAGHGTFGISDGLITAVGIAHRCGSVVTDAPFVASPRDYANHLEYCPYPRDGTCGVCISRCPAGAIGPGGHNKEKCREYLMVGQAHWLQMPGYIGAYAGCGLCQTKVPCESRIPKRGKGK